MNSNFSFITSECKRIAGTEREAEQQFYGYPAYTASALPKNPG